MVCAKEGSRSNYVRDCISEMFGKTQRDCHAEIMCMAVVMIDCKYMRCEYLLCRAEEEENETVEVFNCDQV